MRRLLKLMYLLIIFGSGCSCSAQTKKVSTHSLSEDFDKSPPFDYAMPLDISSIDTSSGWYQEGRKIHLTGTVYDLDGQTPSPDVILYYYHTNIDGIYPVNDQQSRNMPRNNLGQTHGYMRGWVKTDKNGKYSILTVMPGAYPNRKDASHIHITVRDQNMEEPYYLDNFVFDNDELLTSGVRRKLENRGGSGVVRFVQKEGLLIGERNIILGLNIPDYPIHSSSTMNSGKEIGEDVLSFTPFHAYGPDKGSKTCPVCKYGWYHGVLYFVGNNPDWQEIKDWLNFLEEESHKRQEFLKVYFVYGGEKDFSKERREGELEQLGKELRLSKVALTFVPSFADRKSDVYLNEINPEVENTFLLFKRSNIFSKHIDLEPNQENYDRIIKLLDESTNEYFKLKRAKKE